MKSLIALVIIVLGFTIGVKSQNHQGTPPQRPIKPTLSMPVFKDSLKLRRDIKNLKTLRGIYSKLEMENFSIVYQYGFCIDKTGGVILGMQDDRVYFGELNKYIKTVFKNYKWVPSHKLSCKTCIIERLADFNIVFDTTEKYISCAITVSGTSQKVFYEKISMN